MADPTREGSSPEPAGVADPRVRFLRTIGTISRRLSRCSRDIPGLLGAIVEACLELTGAERGYVILCRDGATFEFEFAAKRGNIAIAPEEMKVSRTILARVVRTGKPYVVGDIALDPKIAEIESLQDVYVGFIFCVPMRGPIEEILGALYLESRSGDAEPFQGDLDLVTGFVDLAAMAAAHAIELGELATEVRELRDRLEGRVGLGGILGDSPRLVSLLQAARRAAATDLPVLVEGETGTGKELLARGIHSSSERSRRPLVTVDCGTIPAGLVESELFGHVAGAFTGATADRKGLFHQADGGTIFLDEIEALPADAQAKLLRVLETGEVRRVGEDVARKVDCRVVAATNEKLAALAEAGRFRSDLYYRLRVVHLVIPPLRERREDLPLLVDHFLRRSSAEVGRRVTRVKPWARDALLAYSYPGNVRELANSLRQAVLLARDDSVWLEDLPPEIQREFRGSGKTSTEAPGTFEELQRQRDENAARLEREFVLRALSEAGGNVSEAARKAGVHRVQLHRLAAKHGIDAARFRSSAAHEGCPEGIDRPRAGEPEPGDETDRFETGWSPPP